MFEGNKKQEQQPIYTSSYVRRVGPDVTLLTLSVGW